MLKDTIQDKKQHVKYNISIPHTIIEDSLNVSMKKTPKERHPEPKCKPNIHKTSRNLSERLSYFRFTCCVQRDLINRLLNRTVSDTLGENNKIARIL